MRIYNGTNSRLNLPLTSTQRISIAPKSVSGDIMPSSEFLSLLVSSFDYSELALIISGPFEITLCSSVSGSVGFVVNSLEEAIARFSPKEKVEVNKNEATNETDKKEEVKQEVAEKKVDDTVKDPVKEDVKKPESICKSSVVEKISPKPVVFKEKEEENNKKQ